MDIAVDSLAAVAPGCFSASETGTYNQLGRNMSGLTSWKNAIS